MSVRLMTPGEVSTVKAASKYAYDGRPERPEASGLPFTVLVQLCFKSHKIGAPCDVKNVVVTF